MKTPLNALGILTIDELDLSIKEQYELARKRTGIDEIVLYVVSCECKSDE